MAFNDGFYLIDKKIMNFKKLCYLNCNFSKKIKNKIIKMNNFSLCRIHNYGSNCYLNAGLQILSRCDKFTKWLNSVDYPKDDFCFFYILKDTINQISKSSFFNPLNFINYFTSKNKNFTINSQNCSQLFIKTVLSNLNEEILNFILKYNLQENNIINNINNYSPTNIELDYYKIFLSNNKIFPQSIPYSYFSGIMKIESKGICNKCGEVKKYSFMDFFEQHIYLDTISSQLTDFETVLKENLGYSINVKSSCPKCNNKILFEDISKIIKLPDILVFKIERYIGETNTIPIKQTEIIDVKDYVESSLNITNTLYELFAINIRFGYSTEFGHQICQVKVNNQWFTLNDANNPKVGNVDDYYRNTYGLFYRKSENQNLRNNSFNNVDNNSNHNKKKKYNKCFCEF